MASVRKVDAKWLAEVRLKGFYRSKRFDTKIQAQAWALATEQAHGKHGGMVMGKTLRDAFARYQREVTPSKKGARWELLRLDKLARHPMADILLVNLSREDLQAWVDSQKQLLAPSSINREFTILCAVLSTCRKQWNWMQANPTEGVLRPKDPPPRDRRISAEEIERLLLALEYDEAAPVVTMRQAIAAAFLLSLETAMRQGELWQIDWKDVHLRERYLTLNDTKNGTRRNVPLSTRAVELFGKMSPRGEGRIFHHCTQQTLDPVFRRAVKLAGIEGLHWHDSRHEALTRLARKLDVLDLARMVGHRDPRSLMIYYNPTASEIAHRLG